MCGRAGHFGNWNFASNGIGFIFIVAALKQTKPELSLFRVHVHMLIDVNTESSASMLDTIFFRDDFTSLSRVCAYGIYMLWT